MDIPPKTLKHQLTTLNAGNQAYGIYRSGPGTPSLRQGPDSMPVLEAFQAFLEKEREKSRRRMRTLTAIFVAILLLVV